MVARTLTVVLFGLLIGMSAAVAGPSASNWSSGHKWKARLLVGSLPGVSGDIEYYAGVEIKMEPGWKTYWRHPGDAGGVPPYLDWSKSVNLAQATESFPAPLRFKDATGFAIGYKKHVVLPVRLQIRDVNKPVGIALNIQFGVCREICIPAQAKLALEAAPNGMRSMPPQLLAALDRVPTRHGVPGKALPRVVAVKLQPDTAKPYLMIDAVFPAGTDGADVFVEAAGDIYLPMAKRAPSPNRDVVRHHIDLSGGIDLKSLSGRQLRLTLVSEKASSEILHKLP